MRPAAFPSVRTPEWQKELRRTLYVDNFLGGAAHRRFLEAQANELRPVMVEPGPGAVFIRVPLYHS